MIREAINPNTLFPSTQYGFSHGIKSAGRTTIHCSGQVAWDVNFQIVGAGDLGAQTQQALANLKEVLQAAGATPADVVRMRTYIVDYELGCLETVSALLAEFYGGELPAASTLIGVQALAMPDFLIEIEATAVID